MRSERQTERPRPAARSGGRRRAASQRGVTMTELLATTAIAAVILGLAAPSFLDQVRSNRARTAAQQLSTLLNEARTDAIKRNVPVLVCPSTNGTSCLASPTASSWKGPVIACYNTTGDVKKPASWVCDASTPAAPNPIRVRSAMDASVTLSSEGVIPAIIRFNGLGAVDIFLADGTVANDAVLSATTGAGMNQSWLIGLPAAGAVTMKCKGKCS